MGKMRCMDMFLITKMPMYIVFNPCANVAECACARHVAHLYQGPQNLSILNGRRSYLAYARNTKQHIVNVYKMFLETMITLWYEKTRIKENIIHWFVKTTKLQVYQL